MEAAIWGILYAGEEKENQEMSARMMKYNPAFLTDEELIEGFAVRQAELASILEVVRENGGNSNQHILVVGPRGIGKTTLVLRAAAEIRRGEEFKDKWYPVVYGEESYQVGTAGEFWLEGLFHVAEQTKEERWRRTYEDLKKERDDQRLCERALGQLLDFADERGKRLLLIVENLNMLFGEQMKDNEGWILRHTLLNEKRVMLMGSALMRPAFIGPFKEIECIDKPMFDLFMVQELRSLNTKECKRLWKKITGEKTTRRRIRPIEILTGGNPRLLAIIINFAARTSFQKLMEDLTLLVDEHTDYLKGHLDRLAPQERRVYSALADIWDPATAREVAAEARQDVSKTSSLLNRLVERGAVAVVESKKRTKKYQLAERLYNIYHLMRRRGTVTSRVEAVLKFMVICYKPEEVIHPLITEALQLDQEKRQNHILACEILFKNNSDKKLKRIFYEKAPKEFFKLPDIPRDILDYHLERQKKIAELITMGDGFVESGELVRAEEVYLEAIKLKPIAAVVWTKIGAELFFKLKKITEAENALKKSIEIEPSDTAWQLLGSLFYETDRVVEAEEALRKSIKINAENGPSWGILGSLLYEKSERFEEAENAYRKALEFEPEAYYGWDQLGWLLTEKLNRHEEAKNAFKKSLEINPNDLFAWSHLGDLLLDYLNQVDEAEEAFKKVVSINPKFEKGWHRLGEIYLKKEQYEKAEKAFNEVINLNKDSERAWFGLGLCQGLYLNKFKEGEYAFRRVIKINPKILEAWHVLLCILVVQNYSIEEIQKVIHGYFENTDRSPKRLNMLAKAFFNRDDDRFNEWIEEWSQEAVVKAPEELSYKLMLALVLGHQSKWEEALGLAGEFLEDRDLVEKEMHIVEDFFIDAAAGGYGAEALEVLRGTAGAAVLEPLVVGLQMYVGEEVLVAAEIMEIGKDVAGWIAERRGSKGEGGREKKEMEAGSWKLEGRKEFEI